jgi:hypothetical protein
LRSSETLYDFRIEINESKIANAGLGAYLTYMGARKVKPERLKVVGPILMDSLASIAETMVPLIAEKPGGRTVLVKLKGNNLHGNHNSEYWASTADLLDAEIPITAIGRNKVFRKQNERLSLHGKGIQSHTELENRPLGGIGLLELYTDSDYVPAPGIVFNETLCIDLGVYAPLGITGKYGLHTLWRNSGLQILHFVLTFLYHGRYPPYSDRKVDYIYEIKSFIHSEGPANWGFDVPEKYSGRNQLLDITDDLTGEPHANAKREIPMYVNEVGHDTKLVQNVFIRDENDRTVHYFFRATQSMKGNETVELLTNYKDTYEDKRERMGYGLKNILRGDKSDEDRPTLLRRNFLLRSRIEEKLGELSLREVMSVTEFITEKIWVPLSAISKDFLSKLEDEETPVSSPLTCLQWKALFRLVWLGGKIRSRLISLEKKFSRVKGYKLHCGYFMEMCTRMLGKIHFSNMDLSTLLGGGILDQQSQCVREAVLGELTEETLYSMRSMIRQPFCESFWCPIGSGLLEELSLSVARVRLRDFGEKKTEEQLRGDFLAAAASSMEKLHSCIREGGSKLRELAFASGTLCKNLPYKSLDRTARAFIEGSASPSFSGHGSTPKALLSAISRVYDLNLHGGDVYGHAESTSESSPVFAKKGFLVTECHNAFHDKDQRVKSLNSTVRPFQLLAKCTTDARVNACWYGVWQVAYAVYVFSAMFLPDNILDDMLTELARSIPGGREVLAFAIERCMETDEHHALVSITREAGAVVQQEFRDRMQKARERKPIYRGPPTTKLTGGWPPGWRQETFRRKIRGPKLHVYYSPQLGVKLTSKAEVKEFLKKVRACDGDEFMVVKKRRNKVASCEILRSRQQSL